MLQLQYSELKHAFHYPFTIAKGTKTHQHALLVSLKQGLLEGFGEAPAIHYYNTSVEGMITQLDGKRKMLEHYALTEPKRFWHFLHHLLPGENFLIAALDMAAWDLYARRMGRPLYQVLGIKECPPALTNYTIGCATLDEMQVRLTEKKWPVYKIKIQSADDLDKIIALRVLTTAPFRIDANESLSFEDTKRLLPELKALNVELLEQPLQIDEWEAMRELKQMDILTLIADESCQTEEDVVRCASSFNGINIKLTKCGGITPALRMIAAAQGRELLTMLGNMNESNIGTSALYHLSPLVDFLDADGPLLLKEVHLRNLRFEEGYIYGTDAAGLGEQP